jgi:heme/copper-type cytochrome/quinol oxidase subunit 4
MWNFRRIQRAINGEVKEMEPMEQNKNQELRRGVIVFVLLAALTAVEYVIGINEWSVLLLWVIALVKVGLVMWYFMHILRVFRPDQGGH